jgi:hypothetical protein
LPPAKRCQRLLQGASWRQRTFAVEANITTQNIATLIAMLLSIASDCGLEIVSMLVLFLPLTDRVPLASMALSIRFSIVDLQAFKMDSSPRARVMNEYSDFSSAM